MKREEAKRYWIARYEAAKNWDDPHWEASERKDHRRYVDALKAAIEALSAEAVQLKQTDALIIAVALRYLAEDEERHESVRARASELRERILSYGAKMSAEAVQGWIPVGERLPDENGTYIVSLEDAVYPWATFHNGKWFMLPEDHIAREFGEYEVFAWMPLPEPYKEEEAK